MERLLFPKTQIELEWLQSRYPRHGCDKQWVFVNAARLMAEFQEWARPASGSAGDRYTELD